MKIDSNLRDELGNAFCDAFDYAKLKEPNENKQQFVSRMLKLYAKEMAKAYIIRTAGETAIAQAHIATGALDD